MMIGTDFIVYFKTHHLNFRTIASDESLVFIFDAMIKICCVRHFLITILGLCGPSETAVSSTLYQGQVFCDVPGKKQFVRKSACAVASLHVAVSRVSRGNKTREGKDSLSYLKMMG